MGEVYLAISVLREQARGEQPHDDTAQQRHGDEEDGNIDMHFSSLEETTARGDSHLIGQLPQRSERFYLNEPKCQNLPNSYDRQVP